MIDRIIEKLFGRFSGEKHAEVEIPTEWAMENMPESMKAEITPDKLPVIKIEYVDRKYRVPGLLLAKRAFSFTLLFINIGFGLTGMVAPGGPVRNIMTLFFFTNAFIHLDYLWKTRKGSGEWAT